ncbi:Alpha/Beta hydrolase protein [Boeremia exigua]|uniref:Alpha/Beta hydrolase protein n=1 Tax=Boeremia exigua TaxID=749465 RepID=UPI001E8D1F46|nr:Alpha/Beta hydrolase protein [Boeremia exigua]KAH6614921.1 Alpha/Beta hydrolase protein [Boeremia exigua]
MTQYPKRISSLPYTDSPNPLQTLDIWLPRPLEQSDPTSSTWIVYIHGGAWRDPTQDSRCIEPTLSCLLKSHSTTLAKIAGIASLNYRLSPYPSHPTAPSAPSDASRNAAHPDHVRDVARALRWLADEYGMKAWVGAGHSCGATLLLQYAAGIGLSDDDKAHTLGGPDGLVLLCGIYNVPLLLQNHNPPACPEHISRIYHEFVGAAFGHDAAVYRSVSPVAGRYGTQQWPNGKLMVLAHSYEDELIERQQRDVMCVALDREGWSIVMEVGDGEAEVGEGSRVLEVRDLKGGHDWIWEDGEQVAMLLADVVERLVK